MTLFFCKLRNNIILESDINLAERELKTFFKEIYPLNKAEDLVNHINLPLNCAMNNIRTQGIIGYVVKNNNTDIDEIVTKLSFIQEIWCLAEHLKNKKFLSAPWSIKCQYVNFEIIMIIPLMAAAEILSCLNTNVVSRQDIKDLALSLANLKKPVNLRFKSSINRKNTSNPHVHSLHKYKAKFFPRMIRSCLISIYQDIPKTSEGEIRILDPFVGSGTTIIEASFLGFNSLGIDIDKLSCLISLAKLEVLNKSSLQDIESFINQKEIEDSPLFADSLSSSSSNYSFPKKIIKKFERWGNLDKKKEYENEITKWIQSIKRIQNEELRLIMYICLSDVLTRKFNIRMLGTGVGRFALEIGKTSISSLMKSNLRYLLKTVSLCRTLKSAYNLSFGKSDIICDDATQLPLLSSSFSIILTSPPYLPASSGRENYLVGKSISIKALGLMSDDEIENVEAKSVGSMKNELRLNFDDLPNQVVDLYLWLKSDSLRAIKAVPTAVYYQQLKQALNESYRLLLPQGVAIYIIGKESVFYKYSTREILYQVKCDEIFQEIAEQVGFIIQEKIDIQLDKKNKNARPRSLDSYYESIFFLRKN
ncbi:MAG: DNA methyltransferase [Crocosphaera sp.]|nr:DNA methyltransferase [Crocosphaera sp.]